MNGRSQGFQRLMEVVFNSIRRYPQLLGNPLIGHSFLFAQCENFLLPGWEPVERIFEQISVMIASDFYFHIGFSPDVQVVPGPD